MRSLLLSFALLVVSGVSGSVHAASMADSADQTAMAIPRIGLPGARGVALPQPLSPTDVARVRHIFASQRAGAVTEANAETANLESDVLHGAILADRYLHTAYIPDAAELSTWLSRYGEQPDAPAIRALLDTLNPPATASGKAAPSGVPARTLLVQNDDKAALAAGRALLTGAGTGGQTSDGLFAGGVAAWRLFDLLAARPLFEAAWRTADTASMRAAAAFWAARVAEQQHDRGTHVFWLRRAASQTGTFYAPIARRALSPIEPCVPAGTNKAVVSNADVDALMATPSGKRGFALLQVGERAQAEAEFRALWFDSGPQPIIGRSLMLVAKAVGLSEFAETLRSDSLAAEAAMGRFELPLLRPAGGFKMDPAFVYAVVRHESNFQPLAISPVGARGLMQVMPATAVGIGAIADGQTDRLNDPSTNLAIGQRYLLQLGDNRLVGDDLLRLIAAYGEGPAGMNKWAEGVRYRNDPFLFLEAIPTAFMRQFIEDVLVFQWQYASALRLRAVSLDELAEGVYPRFAPVKAAPGGMRARVVCGGASLKG